MRLDQRRERPITGVQHAGGPVIYWMSRDQRVNDNWALLHAQARALAARAPFAVAFTLVPEFLDATMRQYGFMLAGLKQVAAALQEKGIPFFLIESPEPGRAIAAFAQAHRAGAIVADFDPLRIKRQWKRDAAEAFAGAMLEVDAHNIVPAWIASPKEEVAARTLRPKLYRALPEFLTPFPAVRAHPIPFPAQAPAIDWEAVRERLAVNRSVSEVGWIAPGASEAAAALKRFVDGGLERYGSLRNDPNEDAQSNLSPYLHFGQLSAQRAACAVIDRIGAPIGSLLHERRNAAGAANKPAGAHESAAAFLEELIVRRELSDNFCLYNPHYDSFEGAHAWAQKTLAAHRADAREFLYTQDQFERGATHDPLWNAAQQEMVRRGKMHGYVRMYWAKKILEWSESPEAAVRTAVYLNDKYELDGRDANGYAGVMWSICGIHDRPWFDRPVFGLIRYMAESGMRKKFDVNAYIAAWDPRAA